MMVLRTLVVLFLGLCLTGCIQSEVGIHYVSQTQGEIVQHLRLSDRIDPQDPTPQQWLQSLEQRSRQLGGRAQRPNPQELQVTIPFHNGADLETKFNTFLNTVAPDQDAPEPPQSATALPALTAELQVTERNWIVVQRNHITLDLDLRSLGVQSPSGTLLAGPGNLLDLEFHLTTPWGAEIEPGEPLLADSTSDSTTRATDGKDWVWKLQPGALNHLEATFWVPSVLGLGSVAIALLVGIGSVLRTFLFANSNSSR